MITACFCFCFLSAWIHGGRKREFGLFCSEVIFTFHVRSSMLPLHGQGRQNEYKDELRIVLN